MSNVCNATDRGEWFLTVTTNENPTLCQSWVSCFSTSQSVTNTNQLSSLSSKAVELRRKYMQKPVEKIKKALNISNIHIKSHKKRWPWREQWNHAVEDTWRRYERRGLSTVYAAIIWIFTQSTNFGTTFGPPLRLCWSIYVNITWICPGWRL